MPTAGQALVRGAGRGGDFRGHQSYEGQWASREEAKAAGLPRGWSTCSLLTKQGSKCPIRI